MANLSIHHLNHCISSNKSVSAHLNWIQLAMYWWTRTLCIHGRVVTAISSNSTMFCKVPKNTVSLSERPWQSGRMKIWTCLHQFNSLNAISFFSHYPLLHHKVWKYKTCSGSRRVQQKSDFLVSIYQFETTRKRASNIGNSVTMEAWQYKAF